MRLGSVTAAFMLAACGSEPPFRIDVRTQSPIVVGHEDGIRETAEEAARWWGGSSEQLAGWVMVLTDEPLDGLCTKSACARLNERRIYIDCRILGEGDTGKSTLRYLVRHEIGHAVLLGLRLDADGQHRDPRWSAL